MGTSQALRILFSVRPDAADRVGGDVVQASQTARALRELGHTVDIVHSATPDARGYDLAHVFGVFDPPLAAQQIAACKAANVPLALSPIWWDLTEFFARSRAVEKALTLRERAVEKRLQHIRASAPQQLSSRKERENAARRKVLQRELMLQADVLLPNSITEAHRYVCELDLQHARVQVVPNAAEADPLSDAASGPRSGVLCVGRVESRKNQAMLVYALRDVDVDITLAGECYDAYYRRLCERWNRRVTYTGMVPRERALELMRKALVHALPAWLETPGIASLEAAQAGCAIVNGNRASEFEYFQGDAWYCDPGSSQSIRFAVLAALQAARSGKAAPPDRLRNFTWEQAAKATLSGYEMIL